VAHTAVGPDVATGGAGRCGALGYRGELRPADPGHHPGGAHRTRTNPDLDDVGASREEVAGALRGYHVARYHRHARPAGPDRAKRVEHLALMTVCGVDDQHVDARREQCLGLGSDIAVYPERCGHPQPAGTVQRWAVELGAQCPGRGQHTDQPALSIHRERQFLAAVVQLVEDLAWFGVGGHHHQIGLRHVGQPGEPIDPSQFGLGDQPGRTVRAVEHHHGPVRSLGQQVDRVGDSVLWTERERGVQHQMPGFHPGHRLGDRCRIHVLG
jgi:hypothetical protein